MYLGSLHGLWIVNWKCLAITMVLDFAEREKEETAACDVATLKYREGKAVTNFILHLQMVRSQVQQEICQGFETLYLIVTIS